MRIRLGGTSLPPTQSPPAPLYAYLRHINLKEEAMPDSTATATPSNAPDATVAAYVATWNETDAARRQAGIACAWPRWAAIAIR